jgi:hypothetical protein
MPMEIPDSTLRTVSQLVNNEHLLYKYAEIMRANISSLLLEFNVMFQIS